MIITLGDYWMGRDRSHGLQLSTVIRGNAMLTVQLANDLLGRAGKAGIQLDVSPKTGTHVSSGWRPAVINEHTAGAAPNSKHITGQAVDIYDPEGALDEWCLDHAATDLAIVGLWLEHPAATKGWCHVQTVPPASKRRVFYP